MFLLFWRLMKWFLPYTAIGPRCLSVEVEIRSYLDIRIMWKSFINQPGNPLRRCLHSKTSIIHEYFKCNCSSYDLIFAMLWEFTHLQDYAKNAFDRMLQIGFLRLIVHQLVRILFCHHPFKGHVLDFIGRWPLKMITTLHAILRYSNRLIR